MKLKVEADRNELPADGESLTFIKNQTGRRSRKFQSSGKRSSYNESRGMCCIAGIRKCRSELQKEVTSLIHGIPMTAV